MPRLVRLDTPHPPVILSRSLVVLGRSPDSDLVLTDPSVSRRHARITREGGFWSVSDLGSRSGTRLNGAVAEHQPLHDGDLLELGAVRFRFEETEISWATATFAERPLDSLVLLRSVSGRGAGEAGPLWAVVRAAELLRSCESRDAVLAALLGAVTASFPASSLVLTYFEAEGERTYPEGAAPASGTLTARVRATRAALLVRDVALDVELAGAASVVSSGARSLLACPLWDGDEVRGVLAMTGFDLHFSEPDVDLAVTLCHLAASEIRRLDALRLLHAEQEKRRIWLRFLPAELAADLGADGLEPAEREVCVVAASFVDVEPLARDLEAYLDALVGIGVDEGGGTLVAAGNQGIRLVFGAPVARADGRDAAAAVEAAVRMTKVAEALREDRRFTLVRTRVGVHLGAATVGWSGPSRRKDYRAVGPAMEGAERVMRASAAGRVLVSAAVWAAGLPGREGVPRPGSLVDETGGWWVT